LNNIIEIQGRRFELFLTQQEIIDVVSKIAQKINNDFRDQEVVFLSVLSGAMFFTVDLVKLITIPCKLSFLKLSSYIDIKSTGKISKVLGIDIELNSKNIILVEDIIDTGLTLTYVMNELKQFFPKDLKVASLLAKPSTSRFKYRIDYLGFNIPDVFVVGYGLDYNGYGRNLTSIYKLIE